MSETAPKAVFLSYASQDKEAAARICAALSAAGVEVWFDQSELRGGDSWDAKIRKQIKECALFVPVISAATQARAEGYFRLEWKLAVDRSHLMADDAPFLFPVVIDDTPDAAARVPEKFRDVQWTRLTIKDTPETLAARVGKLLQGHGAGVGRLEPAAGGARSDPRAKPVWARYVWPVIGLLFALIYTVVPRLLPDRHAEPAPAAVAPAAPAPPSVSEARQLFAKAGGLILEIDSTREDFALAEDLLKQALAKDSTDAEVWAELSQLNSRYASRGFDVSIERREAANAAAQRAIRLDPQSFAARFAQVSLIRDALPESEKVLRALHQERPADQAVLHALSRVIQKQGRVDEADALYDESARLPGGDPLALYNKSLNLFNLGRTAEAEAAVQAALAQRTFATALGLSMWYALTLHGDLERAKAILDRLPPAALQEDRPCWFAYMLHLYRREPDAALAVLQAAPRDWLNDNWYRGPKGRLAADALQQAGRPDAAAIERRAALRLVEARLAGDGTNIVLLHNRIILLADLGEREEAARQYSALLQLRGLDPAGNKPVPFWLMETGIKLGRKAEVLRQLSLGLKDPGHVVDYTAAQLRLDPLFDSLRGDPEFPKVIAEAAATEQAQASAPAPAAKVK
jgi:hypothetical protein